MALVEHTQTLHSGEVCLLMKRQHIATQNGMHCNVSISVSLMRCRRAAALELSMGPFSDPTHGSTQPTDNSGCPRMGQWWATDTVGLLTIHYEMLF